MKYQVSVTTVAEIEAGNVEQAKDKFWDLFPADSITANPHLTLMDKTIRVDEVQDFKL